MSLKKEFAKRFKSLRENELQLSSQSEMADLLKNVSQPKISNWENGRTFPKDADIENLINFFGVDRVRWLLSLDMTQYSSGEKIKWIEYIPYHLSEDQREIVNLGVEFFRKVWQDGIDIADLKTEPPFNDYYVKDIYQAFKSVIRKGYIHMVSVNRNREAEMELRQLNAEYGVFPYLKGVYIADIPDVDATLLATECIVHLAMTEILQKSVVGVDAIGICSGYTMLRLAERIVFKRNLLNTIRWIPLMGYPRERISVNSANHIALTLASRYGGSAYRMPLVSSEEDKIQERYILEQVSQMSLAFVTVNGIGDRGTPIDLDDPPDQLRSSDFFHIGNTQLFYKMLEQENRSSEFAGEILGYMLDNSANQIGSEKFLKFHKTCVNPIPIRSLKQVASSGHVWLLAAREYKAHPTYMALKNGLASGLVIDNTIASYLIKRIKSDYRH